MPFSRSMENHQLNSARMQGAMNGLAIWVAWEKQRRSAELAKSLGIELCILSSERDSSIIRYLILGGRTIAFLFKRRPRIIIAQNPSLILVLILCILNPFFKYRLIVDRHSNFKFTDKRTLKWKIFQVVSNFTLRKAELTIVTNTYLCEYVNACGGRGAVLQDKMPEMNLATEMELSSKVNVAVVSSFAEDEPLNEIIMAAKIVKNYTLYVTGNFKKIEKSIDIEKLPTNIIFTGFLSESSYQSLLNSVDIVMVLTNQEYTLTCGAYEAISLKKPLVLSNSKTIRDYFRKGAVYCDSNSASIARCIEDCSRNIARLTEEIVKLREELLIDWYERFNDLRAVMLRK